ncbi:MAG: BlaI/MecI/CopY family transcriptional regulator [Planctomycetota bacterium]|jgi:predicted transcriptional regulator
MGRPPAKELTERELEVMQAFWKHGEATAAELRDLLAADGLDRAYPTIANLVRLLYEKGLLEPTNSERPFRYRAVRSFEEVSSNLLSDMLERVFGGSREQLFVRLLEQKKLTAGERRVLKRILKEHDQ